MYRYKRIRSASSTTTRIDASRRLFKRAEGDGDKRAYPESVGSWLGLTTKLGLLYGGAWLFAYCFFVIGFFPTGISAADSVFLLFVAASFGFVVLILGGVGLHLMQPLFGLCELLFRKPGSSDKKFPVYGKLAGGALALIALLVVVLSTANTHVSGHAWIWLMGSLVVSYCIAVVYLKKHTSAESSASDVVSSGLLSVFSLAILLVFLLAKQWWVIPLIFTQGLLAVAFSVVWQSPQRTKSRALGLLMLGICNLFVPIYITLLFKGEHPINPTLALTFERLGLYRSTSDAIVSNSAAKQVWQLATDHEMDVQGCQLDDGSLLVSRVQVLWHGVGTRSLLRFAGSAAPSSLTQRRIELDAADVRLLSALPQQCTQLPTAIHFASKSDKPVDPAEIDELLSQFRKAVKLAPEGMQLATVQLRGHADSMPLAKDGNVELGLARARSVGAELAKQLEKTDSALRAKVNFDAQSSASRDGRSGTCPFKGDPASLEECHANSRRVEVRLIFKPLES